MQVAKWGNSLAVRLPATVVEALALKEGDEIEIHVAGTRQFGVARKPGRADLLKRLRRTHPQIRIDAPLHDAETGPTCLLFFRLQMKGGFRSRRPADGHRRRPFNN